MLLLVSMRTPRRRGKLVSAVNSEITWGFLFSTISKSSLTRSVTNRPFLSEIVNSRLTRLTSRRMVLPESAWSSLGLLSSDHEAATQAKSKTKPESGQNFITRLCLEVNTPNDHVFDQKTSLTDSIS